MVIDQIEYIKVIRQVERIELKIVEEVREMKLFESHIQTKHHKFKQEQVMDISYKPMSKGRSTVFIHADHGVYSYFTTADPNHFIESVKKTFKLPYI